MGHRVHSHGNRGRGDGVHGDGVHGEGVHGEGVHGDDAHKDGAQGDGAHWNYDYEGVHGSHWCQNGGDDILEGAMVEELLLETMVCLGDFSLLEEVGIQIYVACEDGDNLWIHRA